MIAFDIETDTSPVTPEEKAQGFTHRGLDPRITPITAFAMASDAGVDVFMDAPEEDIIAAAVEKMAERAPARVITWNGAVFDLPFLVDRAARYGIETGIELTPNPSLVPKYDPTPGHAGGYDATWFGAAHTDVAYAVKEIAEAEGVSWSLKPYAQFRGLTPVEVDRLQMHRLTPEELRNYVASDAIVTLELARIEQL